MDGDKLPLRNGVPPSLPLLLSITGSILIAYGTALGRNSFSAAGIIAIAPAFPLVAYIVRGYRESVRARTARISAYIAIITLFAIIGGISARSGAASPAIPSGTEFLARVTAIEEGRYSDRIILSLSSLRAREAPPINAIGFAKHGTRAEGDILAIECTPEKIAGDDPFAARRFEGINFKIRLSDKDCAIISKGVPSFRKRIRRAIIRKNISLYGEKPGAVINALYLGDSYFIDRKTNYDFTRAGVLHILAASGSHVAIVAGIPLFFLFLLPIPRKFSFLIVSLLLALYFHITCAPVSLLRACVMFWVVAFFRITGERCPPFNALYLSGSIILLAHPWEIFSLGFQLSFGATAGIIAFYRFYRDSMPRMLQKIANSLALTFAAQTGVLPIIAVTLSQINFTGICANLVIVPLIEMLMAGSIAIDILSFAGIPLTWVGNLIGRGMLFTLSLCEHFARFPGHFVFNSVPLYFIIPYGLLLIPVLFRFRKHAFRITLAAIVSAFIPCHLMFNTRDGSSAHGNAIRPVSSREEMLRKEKAIRSSGYNIPSIDLSPATYEAIRWTDRFIQRNPVAEIRVPRSVRITPAFRSLCESVEREGVILRFTDADKK